MRQRLTFNEESGLKMNRSIWMAAAFALGFAADTAQAAAPMARVAQGTLAGITERDVSAYLGVPYAAAPTGTNRWRAPQAPAQWTGVRKADHAASGCMQEPPKVESGPYTSEFSGTRQFSEDCLYLNVWTPAKVGKRAPVMVWIHGGGFQAGSGSGASERGAALARQGVVVVTINYRLGVFGFLAHPELTREAGGAPPTNFALQDQIAALRWVKDNIAAFGGDPSQVTVAGQSAGAISVNYLLASPLAKGLFVRAIAQSGLSDWMPLESLAEAERGGLAFAQVKGATSLEALRALPAETIQAKGGGAPLGFLPVLDGQLIRQQPDEIRAAGWPGSVPMLTGFTADEMVDPIPVTDAASFKAKAGRDYGAYAERMAAFYPAENPAEAARALTRDRGVAGLYAWQRGRKGGPAVYAYLFDHWYPGPQSEILRSFHSVEIPYVFGTLDAAPDRPFTSKDHEISRIVSRYWVNFVRTGNPNGHGLPKWPAFSAPSFELMELGDRFQPRPIFPAEQRKVFDEYLDQGGGTSPLDALKDMINAAKAAAAAQGKSGNSAPSGK
jgi:para-nitrobenzyl esterase